MFEKLLKNTIQCCYSAIILLIISGIIGIIAGIITAFNDSFLVGIIVIFSSINGMIILTIPFLYIITVIKQNNVLVEQNKEIIKQLSKLNEN